MLLGVTIWVNFIGLMLALWLGLYLVTRNTRSSAAWLFALAIWSAGGIFLNQLLALHPPTPPPPEATIWVTHLILFWPHNVFELGWQGWLRGWLPAYGIAFWYHATLTLRPGRLKQPVAAAWPGYIFALAGILLKTRYLATWTNPAPSPLYSSPLPGFIFAFDAVGTGIFAGLSLANLSKAEIRSGSTLSRQHFRLLVIATLAAGAAGIPGFIASLFQRLVPQVWATALLSLALILGGIGVARYLASPDRSFFLREYPVFRAGQKLGSYLPNLFLRRKNANGPMGQALRQLVDATGATWLIVARATEGGLQPAGSWNWKGEPLDKIFTGDPSSKGAEKRPSLPEQVSPPFDKAALILPLYHQEREQAGVLLAGAPRKQAEYTPSQLSAFHDSMKLIAGLVDQAGDGKGEGPPGASASSTSDEERAGQNEPIAPRQVALALRNLHDYAYLADLPLADLRLVRDCSDSLEMGMNGFVQRGKALSSVLEEAVFRLRPDLGDPPETPSRSWYPYLILRKAYLEGLSNRAIMSQLYISEGTFNRTRRAAIQSVARILEEMEAG